MQLSILILSHNRPTLFDRCIRSVLDNLPSYPIEILVNNDTQDINEVHDSRVLISYTYEASEDISDLYKRLFDSATGEFIFFLEDDDYILPSFFSELNYTYDINFINFVSNSWISTIQNARQEFGIDEERFQLSQIVFRKQLVATFPSGNNLHNDWLLFKSLDGSMILNKRRLWVQTTDGKDNISYAEYNTDDRFPHLY